DAVVGEEAVTGEGFAGDEVEGLVSASVAHAAAGPNADPQAEALEWQAQSSASQAWDAPSSSARAASAAADWGQPAGPSDSTGWTEDVAALEQRNAAGQEGDRAPEQTASAAGPAESHEAEVPDAWAATDDPLAGTAPADPLAVGTGPGDPLAGVVPTPDREEPSAVHRRHSSTQE